ncbi:hypothetical protein P7K49_011797 [Saguinus oedipus]|uniref:Uncharacterized protein n=1 Tax=Saguinus oedipus TaxID=9490 RepID=A0ABQ9VSE7_SAGOE|nr:hypothetical protein P7K49_011797 [Saguinus oedipus]
MVTGQSERPEENGRGSRCPGEWGQRYVGCAGLTLQLGEITGWKMSSRKLSRLPDFWASPVGQGEDWCCGLGHGASHTLPTSLCPLQSYLCGPCSAVLGLDLEGVLGAVRGPGCQGQGGWPRLCRKGDLAKGVAKAGGHPGWVKG